MSRPHDDPGTGMPDELVRELRYLEIYTRRRIDNLLLGSYTSPFKGTGFDFWEHRRYEPGDDVRRIDWNATARLGQVVMKTDHAERELNAILVVDLSRSMEFTSRKLTKRELLLRVAGCLAFSAASDQLHVGLLAFTDQLEAWAPPRQGRLQAWRILEQLWRVKTRSQGTDFNVPIEALARRLRKTTVVFLISDFSQTDFLTSGAFRMLAHRHDVIPIIIQDPLEEELLGAGGYLRLRDLESGEERVVALNRKNRRLYVEEMRRRREALVRECYSLGLDHVYLRVGDSYVDPLVGTFLSRKRKRR